MSAVSGRNPSLLAAFPMLLGGFLLAAPLPPPAPETPQKPLEVEVRCQDDSVLKLRLLDKEIALKTKYGTLNIAVADIRKIEFATRTPSHVEDTVRSLIEDLGHSRHDIRESASKKLHTMREAYGLLRKAQEDSDPERRNRADSAVETLRRRYVLSKLEPRPKDVISTDDSVFSGTIAVPSLQVETVQFGVQNLRLSHICSLQARIGSFQAVPGPTKIADSMYNHRERDFAFTLTGAQQGGSIWGSDIYTVDSFLPMAAVHAGKLQAGQTGVVRVRIVAPPTSFSSSTRNGVSSTYFGAYTGNAFVFLDEP